MKLEKEREALVFYAKKMLDSGLTTGTSGNISIYNRNEGLAVITPSSVDYHVLGREDMIVLDPAGRIVEGDLKPSSETGFHLALYRQRADVGSVVHTHSVYATTFACLRREIPAVHYLVGFAGRKVPLADYATFGTDELAANITAAIGESNALLLANHGLVAVGPGIAGAFQVAEEVEYVARICFQAECIGSPVRLSDEEMDDVMTAFRHYGQGTDNGQ